MLQMLLFLNKSVNDIDMKKISRLADILQVPTRNNDIEDKEKWINALCDKYSFAVTKYILCKCKEFLERRKKKLLVVLFDPCKSIKQLLQSEDWYDLEIVDYLKENGFNYFDINEVNLEDFRCFNLSVADYYKRYFIGHYNPSGNYLFAFAIKNRIIEILEPNQLPIRMKRIQSLISKAICSKY